MIEAAIAKGAGRFLAVEYVMALRAAGETARAAAEFPIAVEVMRKRLLTHVARVPSSWRPIVVEAKAEIERLETLRDWNALQARLDRFLTRPSILLEFESWAIRRVIWRMHTIDYPSAEFQAARFWQAGRFTEGSSERTALESAARCGHPEAIRLRAQMALRGELRDIDVRGAIGELMWLDSRTNAERDLVSDMKAMPGAPFVQREREIESLNRFIGARCAPHVDQSSRRERYW